MTGSDPVISSDMTVELQSSSAQMGYMLVVSLSDLPCHDRRQDLHFACRYAAYAVGMNNNCPPGCLTRDFVVVNLSTCVLFE